MTYDDRSSPAPSAARTGPQPPPLPWLLILGLASLSLLWPLTALWEIGQGAPRALTILTLTTVVWIGVVGGGRVPRPVLTLMLAGVLHGVLGMALGGVLAGDGPFGDPAALWILLPALGSSAAVGALLGLVALGVQKVLGPRTGDSTSARGES